MTAAVRSVAGAGLDAVLRPAWVVVDLDALEHNLASIRSRVAPAGVLAVVKADAYGHGAPQVGLHLERAGVDWLGVALLEEGIELRRVGVEVPILVLGPSVEPQLPLYRRYALTPAISSLGQLTTWMAWADAAASPQTVHLKVDTGMHRLGIAPEELPTALASIRGHASLELGGLLSHLADADDLESPRTAAQTSEFEAATAQLTAEERSRVVIHLANSAGALHHPASRHSLVRAGLALYGIDPAGLEAGLRPVMSVVSRVTQERLVPTGARPGYGGAWTAPRPSRLGVVPVGYADGYGKRLSNRADVLVRGRRAPVVGAVTMDMTLIDLTEVAGQAGDEVVLLGRQGEAEITAGELAGHIETITWEVLCLLGLRLPRRYVRGGVDVALESHFVVDSG